MSDNQQHTRETILPRRLLSREPTTPPPLSQQPLERRALCMLWNTRRAIGMDCEEDALPFPVRSGRCYPTEFVLPNRHDSNERSVDDPLTGFSLSHILFQLGREGTTVPTLTEVVSYYVPYNDRN
jgi:hypothetical protein